MNTTLTLEGRGRVTRCLSVDTTLAVSSPASGTVWQNDPGGRRMSTAHPLFMCLQVNIVSRNYPPSTLVFEFLFSYNRCMNKTWSVMKRQFINKHKDII